MTVDVEPAATAGRDTRISQLIFTIFGLYARAESNWLSVASVVRLLAENAYLTGQTINVNGGWYPS